MMIHVAVGIVSDATHRILVARRHSHVDHGGLWEFPGGKVEENESVYQALCRELKEEIQIEIVAATPLIKVKYDYDRYSVLLDTWKVDVFNGEPQGAEGQIIQWVNFSMLKKLNMPAANYQIIESLYATTT